MVGKHICQMLWNNIHYIIKIDVEAPEKFNACSNRLEEVLDQALNVCNKLYSSKYV